MVSLGLNHPKNFLGYTLAVAESDTQAEELLDQNSIVRAYSDARNGAEDLGLIKGDSTGNSVTVTPLGERVVAFAQAEYGGTLDGLRRLGKLYGSSKRFVTAQPEWEDIVQTILLNESEIAELIEYLREFTRHRTESGSTILPLSVLFAELYRHDKQFAEDMFLRTEAVETVSSLSIPPTDILSAADLPNELDEPSLYYGPTIHHLKSILYHAGILTTPGTNSTNLNRDSDNFIWELDPDFLATFETLHAEPTTVQPHDEAVPDRIQVTTTRVNRDTQQVRELKDVYNHECQICGMQLQKSPTDYYAEGHHLQPLGDGHDGPDVKSNIIIVCPNCHADCDHGMLHIDPETHKITHTYNDRIDGETLTTITPHSPHPHYLNYHNHEIANQ